MKFTWDANKAAVNKQKHGVTFEEASTVFDDCDALRILIPITRKTRTDLFCLG